jgi:lysophospholipase L1-like esterase
MKMLLCATFCGALALAQTPAPAPAPVDAAAARQAAQERLLKDFPNLARYHDENAKLAPPAPGETRVAFMGDSITDGWGRRMGQFFPGKPYVNRGISGQTTPQMLIRFRPDILALRPKVVVILAGTNDIAGNTGPMTLEAIEDNLQSMAELAKANGIRVVLSSVMPVCDYHRPQTVQRPPKKILALNAWIKNYALQNGHVYLDYHSAMLDDKQMLPREITNYGLHPNAAGYEIMGPLAEKAIAQALAGN